MALNEVSQPSGVRAGGLRNLTSAFQFVDEFDDGSFDTTTRWSIVENNGSITESNGTLKVECNNDGTSTTVETQDTFLGVALVTTVELNEADAGTGGSIGFNDRNGTYVVLEQNRGGGDWQFRAASNAGGSSDSTNLGTIGLGPFDVRIEWDADSEVRLFLDGTQEATLSGSNVVPDVGLPVHINTNNGSNDPTTIFTVDYSRVPF